MKDIEAINKVFLVGASGPLSKLAAEHLRSERSSVTVIGRSTGDAESKPVPGFMPKKGFPPAGSTVVFFAWPTADRRWNTQRRFGDVVEVWSRVCRQNKVRFIFISSTQASDATASTYGRGKRRAEKLVLENGGIVLRVGLVIDDSLNTLATKIRSSWALSLPMCAVGRVPVEPVTSADFLESLSGLLDLKELECRTFMCHQGVIALRVLRRPDYPSKPKVGLALQLLVRIIARGPKIVRERVLIDGLVGLVSRANEMDGKDISDFVNLSTISWMPDQTN